MELYESWAGAVAEFERRHIDGAGISDGAPADLETCRDLIDKARVSADTSKPLPDGRVHCDYFWITDIGGVSGSAASAESAALSESAALAEVVGFIALRHELNDLLMIIGGHIGYSVRPSRRREGIARTALGLVLREAEARGLDRLLITCDDDNVASYRTIESCGGVLQDVRDRADQGYGLVRRYWVELPATRAELGRRTERETE
ncbi:GNAT family N-acetyltransferase [Microlunatus elymi]|nr:GNAT family N-acetyltransferase [Microlunatus elymi]